MRPPECDICGEDADDLVRFASHGDDRAVSEHPEAARTVGHPPDSAWLCPTHAPLARALPSATTRDKALAALRRPQPGSPTPQQPEPPAVTAGAFALTPIEIGEFERRLRDVFLATAESMGLTGVTPTTVDDRRWMPMDGSQPPDCPFVDESVREAHDPTRSLALRFERSHWNSEQIARASVTLAGYQAQGQAEFRVAAHTPASGENLEVTEVTVTGDIPAPVREVLGELVRP